MLCCAVLLPTTALSLSLSLTLLCVVCVCRVAIIGGGRVHTHHTPHLPRCDGCDGDVCVVCEIDFWRCGLRTYSRPVGGGHSRQLMWESCSKSKILSIFFLSPALFIGKIFKVCRRRPSSVVCRLYLLSSHVSTLVMITTHRPGVKNRLMFQDVTG